MKFGTSFGTHKLVERYPSLNEATVGATLKISLKLLLEGKLWDQVGRQRVLTKGFEHGIEQIDFGKDKAIVQVGANDGMHSDPLRPILAKQNMKAVLVEPITLAFEALSRLYENRPATYLMNNAIAAQSGHLTLYSPRIKGRELQSTLWACKSKEQVIREIKRNVGKEALGSAEISEMQVEAQTAAQLCKDCDLDPKNIAVLVVDTEGQDAEIVGSFLDAGASPEVIYYEQLHVPPHDATVVKERLSGLGYSLDETHKDVLARLVRN
ncbi:MAG: hypothetical protein JWO47_198 [Candidatus Saccharibacteria bacterium]|nr:hypothetical protein [Candidatus Saccharibacteria bacterium]